MHVGKESTEDEEPHVYQVGHETVVGYAAESVFKGYEARLEQMAEVFEEDGRESLRDAEFDVDTDEAVEVFHRDGNFFVPLKDDQESRSEIIPGFLWTNVGQVVTLQTRHGRHVYTL